MISGIREELEIFAIAVITGAIVRLFYEFLCCLRMVVHHSRAAAGAEDFLFWLFSAGYVFVQIYQTNSGDIRWYFALGIVSGVLALTFFLKKIPKRPKKNLRN